MMTESGSDQECSTDRPGIESPSAALNLATRPPIGVVAIGRNEGARLRRCLASLTSEAARLVYVDSGSTDESVNIARSFGVQTINLDLTRPFTAARARNAGLSHLLALYPEITHVFFVDGDCEVDPSWLPTARQFLDTHPTVAVVSGLRQERYPERSIYNLLTDLEWRDYPYGEVTICGGDALIRVDAIRDVGGYRDDLICGEEPEMCVRLRQKGWSIWRIREPMTRHDVAITRFRQWWIRMVRTGYAYGQGMALHGHLPERYCVRELISALGWTVLLPLMTLFATLAFGHWGLALLAVYPIQLFRLAIAGQHGFRRNSLRAGALMTGKFAETAGVFKYWINHLSRSRSPLIEYK